MGKGTPSKGKKIRQRATKLVEDVGDIVIIDKKVFALSVVSEELLSYDNQDGEIDFRHLMEIKDLQGKTNFRFNLNLLMSIHY